MVSNFQWWEFSYICSILFLFSIINAYQFYAIESQQMIITWTFYFVCQDGGDGCLPEFHFLNRLVLFRCLYYLCYYYFLLLHVYYILYLHSNRIFVVSYCLFGIFFSFTRSLCPFVRPCRKQFKVYQFKLMFLFIKN